MPSLSTMEDEEVEEQELQRVPGPGPEILSPSASSSGRRSCDSNPPEFEFWMVRNPSCPNPDLHSADELFSGGVLLPLHLLQPHNLQSTSDQPNPPPPPPTPQEAGEDETEPTSGSDRAEPGLTAALTSLSPSAFTSSKRWRDIIFKRIDRNGSRNVGDDVKDDRKEKDKVKKKESKNKKKKNAAGNVGNSGVPSAELNINIWPFRRSRSAGNGGSRPRSAAAATNRKVSSAPCSRSNSAGESKSRKWPTSPSRGGVHLGRNSPVWQVRRGSGTAARISEAAGKSAEKGQVQKEGAEARRKNATTGGVAQKARMLNINVPPMCIGYRQQLSCRSDEMGLAAPGGSGGGSGEAASGDGGRGGNIFNIRSLFSKKVY